MIAGDEVGDAGGGKKRYASLDEIIAFGYFL